MTSGICIVICDSSIYNDQRVYIGCVCFQADPGHVNTDMSRGKGALSVDEGIWIEYIISVICLCSRITQ